MEPNQYGIHVPDFLGSASVGRIEAQRLVSPVLDRGLRVRKQFRRAALVRDPGDRSVLQYLTSDANLLIPEATEFNRVFRFDKMDELSSGGQIPCEDWWTGGLW